MRLTSSTKIVILTLILAMTACQKSRSKSAAADDKSQQSLDNLQDEDGSPSSNATSPIDVATRDGAPALMWDIPAVPPTIPADGFTLGQLSSMAKAGSSPALLTGFNVEEALQSYQMTQEKLNPDRDLTNPDEKLETINQSWSLYRSKLAIYVYTAADQIALVHDTYFKIIKARATLKIFDWKTTYLNSIKGRISTLVQQGNHPQAWLDVIDQKILDNHIEKQATQKKIANLSADLVHQTGGTPDLAIGGINIPEFSSIIEPVNPGFSSPAISISPEIDSLTWLQDISSRERDKLQWKINALNTSTDQDEITVHMLSREVEQAKIDALEASISGHESEIETKAVQISNNLEYLKRENNLLIQKSTLVEKNYSASLQLLQNGEVDFFYVILCADEVFENYKAIEEGTINYLNELARLDRLLLENVFSIALEEPELP